MKRIPFLSFYHVFGLCVLLLLIACPEDVTAQKLKSQRGYASYYSDWFHGRTMANGQRYHRDSMTCAHMRYPLGTRLHVRNINSGAEVVVRVTDRGPYSRKFILDLSRAAARRLGYIRTGFTMVEITPLPSQGVLGQLLPASTWPEPQTGFGMGYGLLEPIWLSDSTMAHVYPPVMLPYHFVQKDRLHMVVTSDSLLLSRINKQ